MSEFSQMLQAVQSGGVDSAERLLTLVYDELRKLAAAKLAREVPGQTLQPTALVHEAWLRLSGNDAQPWNGRAHFFGAAAEAMRRILIENARRKRAVRHGGGLAKLDIGQIDVAAAPGKEEEWLAVGEAVENLADHDAQFAQLVKLRYFAGLTTEEAAEVLGVSVRTADRWWRYSRAWLYQELERLRAAPPPRS